MFATSLCNMHGQQSKDNMMLAFTKGALQCQQLIYYFSALILHRFNKSKGMNWF